METVIDSSLWVDYFRPNTPAVVKQRVVQYVNSADAVLCEPVRFEILGATRRTERKRVNETLATLPLLSNPTDLWQAAIHLGQKCVDAGTHTRSLDLLIAVVCLHHDVTIVTFDADFAGIAKVCPLRVQLLDRRF